jgi:hypothetical protein
MGLEREILGIKATFLFNSIFLPRTLAIKSKKMMRYAEKKAHQTNTLCLVGFQNFNWEFNVFFWRLVLAEAR